MFLTASGYLLVAAIIMFADPGLLPLRVGAPLLQGMEIAGPYLFLLVAALGALIGGGLLGLNNWARLAAIFAAALGVAAHAPGFLRDVLTLQFGNLLWSGLGIGARAIVVWYLYQSSVTEAFRKGIAPAD